jgi:hypothetical protein
MRPQCCIRAADGPQGPAPLKGVDKLMTGRPLQLVETTEVVSRRTTIKSRAAVDRCGLQPSYGSAGLNSST